MMRRRKDVVSDIVDILLEPLRRARELALPPVMLERPEIEPIEEVTMFTETSPEIRMRQVPEYRGLLSFERERELESLYADLATPVPGYEYLRSREIWKYLR